jgi:hypothetical protein
MRLAASAAAALVPFERLVIPDTLVQSVDHEHLRQQQPKPVFGKWKARQLC